MISSKKINLIAILLIAAALIFTVCVMLVPQNTITGHKTGLVSYSDVHSVSFTKDDYYTTYAEGGITKINLSGTTASSKSNNVTVEGGKITILGGGVYVLSGTLDDGNIVVDSSDGAEVRLILNQVSVTSSDFSP